MEWCPVIWEILNPPLLLVARSWINLFRCWCKYRSVVHFRLTLSIEIETEMKIRNTCGVDQRYVRYYFQVQELPNISHY